MLLFYEVMKPEPCWCGGNKKRGKRASDHAMFDRNWWHVIAWVKKKNDGDVEVRMVVPLEEIEDLQLDTCLGEGGNFCFQG